MGWEFHAAKTEFKRFAEDWDRLNATCYHSHPFFDSRFVGPLLDYFSNGQEKLCIHRTNGVVSGALILQPNGFGRWSSFQPSQAQATAVLLDDARCLESLFRTLPGFVWTIELPAMDPRYSPDFSCLALPQIAHPHARTIGIQLKNSFQDYWTERPKKLIANIDRYSRRTEKELGSVFLSKFEDAADMEAGVKRFGELESAGWKGAAGTAVSSNNQQGAFYSDVLRGFAKTAQAAVYELRLNDQLTSSRLVISNDDSVIFLKTTYDESLARFAPGRILLHRVIQQQFTDHAGKTIEFYTNASRDQEEWATFACTIQNIQLFRNILSAAVFSVIKVAQRNLRGETHRKPPPDGSVATVPVHAEKNVEGFVNAHVDLREFSARDTIETSIDWFGLLQKQIYPNDSGVRYYFVAKDNRPTTILPVRLTTKGRVRTVEALGNYYTSLYTPLLSDDSDTFALRHLLATATRDHGGAHVMRFAPMDPESLAYKALLNELRAIGWIPFKFLCFGNWFLNVNDGWEGYLKKRSPNLRSSIKRRCKKFSDEGGTLEIVTKSDKFEQGIAAFQEVYSASWKIPEPYPDFVPSLIRLLCSKGMLRLGIAWLHEKPIAAQLWIVGQEKASIYKVAYHEAFASFSPGTVLTSHLLQHVIDEDHVKEVDFLIGDDKYKQIWMSNRRERWGIIAYNPRTLIGFASLLKETLGRATKFTIKQSINTSFKPRQITRWP